ncbi:MAG: mannitol dehydrogenase family protein [Pseudomonadota bacterium]
MAFDQMPRLSRTGSVPKVGLVHFGPGAFFRAFTAVYTHEAMAAAGGDWGITAVSLKSPRAREQLKPQGYVYTAIERAAKSETARLITSVADVLVAPEDPGAVISVLANPAIKVVTLTITEKGYGFDPVSGGLDRSHPDIVADLGGVHAPRSAMGFLLAGLAARKENDTPPFTVLSCDNLPSNGHVTRRILLEFAQAVQPELSSWIETKVSFPSTMVDRITPATQDEDIKALAKRKGYRDEALVVHEPFRQWVIEDSFNSDRPAWENAGAQFVESVDAHETMKLRCLNGTHSALAYLGYLAGHETIADAVAQPDFEALCQRLWHDEILPTVPPPEDEDLAAYVQALMVRYRNPNIRHRTWQIAMDGSQKLPQRILGTVRDRLAAGVVPLGLCLVVAAWMRYSGGVDEVGKRIDVRDPLAERLHAASERGATPEEKVSGLLAIEEVFGTDLPNANLFRDAVTDAYVRLVDHGATESVALTLEQMGRSSYSPTKA